MDKMHDVEDRRVEFIRSKRYADAVNNTDDGLIPIAVKMMSLQYESDYIPDPEYTRELTGILNDQKLVLLSMTTVFDTAADNGKWGWAILPNDLRAAIGEDVINSVGFGEWVFYAQVFKD